MADSKGLASSLRRHDIAQVYAKRPKLHGAHLAYLQHGKGLEGQNASRVGPQALQPKACTQAAHGDPHQCRVVVSTPNHPRLDRTQDVELFMAQGLQDFAHQVDWVAAHHSDTEHPHTHIVLRGRTTEGKDRYMEKHSLTQGLRDRASQLLTWFIGPRQPQQGQQRTPQTERQAQEGGARGVESPNSRQRQARDPLPGSTRIARVGRVPVYVDPQPTRLMPQPLMEQEAAQSPARRARHQERAHGRER